MDLVHLGLRELREITAPGAQRVLRVVTQANRVAEERVGPEGLLVGGGGAMPGRFNVGRIVRRRVGNDADGRPPDHRRNLATLAQYLNRAAVGDQRVVQGTQNVHPRELQPRRLDAVTMTEADEALRLVERDPVLHAVAEMTGNDLGVLREPSRRSSIEPPALAVQVVRIIPMKEGNVRSDPGGEEPVDQLIVEFQSALVHFADARGQDARPGEAQPVCLQPELLHDRDIVAPAVVMIAGNVPGMAGEDRAVLAAEHVPDATPASTLARTAFNLIGRRGGTPYKMLRIGHD